MSETKGTVEVVEYATQDQPTDIPKVVEVTRGKWDVLNTELAFEANVEEHAMGMRESLKLYWKGVLWSMFINLSIIMRAYDIEVVGNFFALPAFQQRFGKLYIVDGQPNWQVPAAWQLAFGYGATIGQLLGSYFITFPMEKYGRKKSLAAMVLLTGLLVFMQFFSTSIGMLTAAEYLCGFIWGSYVVLTVTYASEVLPLSLRGYLVGYINLAYIIGQFLSTGVITGFATNTTEWAYKIPFAIQWVWPIIIVPGLYFAPESPWWLVRQGRYDDCKKHLARITVPSPKIDFDKQIAMMIQTTELEKKLKQGVTFFDCFRGHANRRRTEIVCMLMVIQDFSGNPIGYASYLFEQIGLSPKSAFDMSLGINGVGFVFTILSLYPLVYLGHRRTYMGGLFCIVVILYIVAFLSFAKNYKANPAYGWAQGSLLIILQGIWQMTQGPGLYIMSCECPSTRLRAMTIAVANVLNTCVSLAISPLGPFLLNPGAINAGAKTELFYAGMSTFTVTWCFFRLPEMSRRTFSELDLMFERKIPTRQFRTYKFDEADLLTSDVDEMVKGRAAKEEV